ncbi:hypothetical protein ATW93_01095 [Oenococcus oeni]|uniref:DUF805 domain-containing protein n=1 Tax=Oenococcus oeni TaxID=1247 RepID=UPI0008F83652|nr:hypothetical protein ATW93_01095 [Oenococcus oeni]
MLNAYKKYWKNYFNFKDSSSRSDYWWLILANVIIFTILLIFSNKEFYAAILSSKLVTKV